MSSVTTTVQTKGEAADALAELLDGLIARTDLDLEFELVTNGSDDEPFAAPTPDVTPDVTPDATPGLDSAIPALTVEFSGPDTPLLLERNAELLHALEHIAAKILHLEPEDHDRISFDAEGYKATRHTALERSAELAIETVRTSGRPYSFAPMTSRERRMLHLILSRSGLPTASSGMGPRRFVVLYPEGFSVPAQTSASAFASTSNDRPRSTPGNAERTAAIRDRFRRR